MLNGWIKRVESINRFYWDCALHGKKKKKRNSVAAIITLNPATNHELTLWTCVMEGEDKDEAHNEGDGNVGGAAWGLSWTGVSSSLRRQILLHYWWKWTAEGFRKGQCWAVSACHVTLIDTAFAAAQEPFCPGLPFQIAAWFIYRDNRLNNQRGVSGLSCGFWADVPSKRQRLVSLQNTRKKRSSCKTWRVRTNSSTGWTILNHQTEGARLCYKNRMGLTIIELTVKPATEWAYVRCECSGLEKSDQTTTRIPKKVAILFKMQIKTECNRLQMNCVYWQFYKVFLSPWMNMLYTVMLWTSVYLVLPCWCCSRTIAVQESDKIHILSKLSVGSVHLLFFDALFRFSCFLFYFVWFILMHLALL